MLVRGPIFAKNRTVSVLALVVGLGCGLALLLFWMERILPVTETGKFACWCGVVAAAVILIDANYGNYPITSLLAIVAGLGCGLPFLLFWFDQFPSPSGTSWFGLRFGIVAAFIIVFEAALWWRKRARGYRVCNTKVRKVIFLLPGLLCSVLPFMFFGFSVDALLIASLSTLFLAVMVIADTKTLMFFHIWLGLLCLPLALIHSGFALGGFLSGCLLIVFLVVIASGIWGLYMQQIIPRKLLNEVPGETIIDELDMLMEQYSEEAEALAAPYINKDQEAPERGGATPTATQIRPKATFRSRQLAGFFESHVRPFLKDGSKAGGVLAFPARSRELFADLRLDASEEFREVVDKLEKICDTRRQFDRQARLQFWLHSWLCIHTPLSAALLVLLGYHAVVALKFW